MIIRWSSFVCSLVFVTQVHCRENCVLYDKCENELETAPCVVDHPPKPFIDIFVEEEKQTAVLELFQEICPEYYHGENTTACCSVAQLVDMKRRLALANTVGMGRCPSCMYNFRKIVCGFACSPKQGQYVRVISSEAFGDYKDEDNPTETVTEAIYLISKKFAHALYESCKGMRGFTAGTTIMDIGVCGDWGSKGCSPERWVEFMGVPSEEGGHSPFKLHYITTMEHEVHYQGETLYPMNVSTTKCSESPAVGQYACSCDDCEAACSVESTLPLIQEHHKEFTILKYDGTLFVVVLIFVLLAGAITIIYWMNNTHHAPSDSISCLSILSCHFPTLTNKSMDEVESLKAQTTKPDIIPEKNHRIKAYQDENNCKCFKFSFFKTLSHAGHHSEKFLQTSFSKWGRFVYHRPVMVMGLSLFASAVLACGFFVKFTVTTNPVELWVSPTSEARQNMEYFNKHFGPFYRVQQLIVTPVNTESFHYTVEVQHEYVNVTWGPAFRQDFLIAVLELQQQVMNLVGENNSSQVLLNDICVSPLKPLNSECAIQSIFGLFQNNPEFLQNETRYLTHFKSCSMSPMDQKCFAPYGGPLDSTKVVLGGFEESNYETAKALIITIPVVNYYEAEKNLDALAWESKFLEFMNNYSHPLVNVAYKAEKSVEDELERGSHSDIVTVGISYLLMLCYITIALGEVKVSCTFFVDSKLTLGFFGVLIVLVSVVSSLGAFSYFGIPATLIIVEVIPFLVLAVGVDNIFILVQAYQRDKKKEGEDVEDQLCRVIGDIAPSMMLSSVSMCSCFFIGALTEMPAVKIFALYAGVALLLNFFLQMTCFLSLFALDIRRHADNRLDVCCCVKASEKIKDASAKEGLLFKMCSIAYAPFLMKDGVRYSVIMVFMAWLFASITTLHKIEVGLDPALSVPEDSYMLTYFTQLNKYLSVGPPLYFVITDGYNYSDPDSQTKICSSMPTCDNDSILLQLKWMAKQSNRTYVAVQPFGWFDIFNEFLRSDTCCYSYKSNNTFCPSQIGATRNSKCKSCRERNVSKLTEDEFNRRANIFLQDVPWFGCPKSGKAMFSSAVEWTGDNKSRIGATNFRTYHTVLKTSEDYFEALRWARLISANLTKKIQSQEPGVEVFPYSLVHVFYEQYLTMWPDTVKSLLLSLTAVFIATFLLLGLDLNSAAIVVITITMIVVNLLGLMYFWSIPLNAVSLVNLVVAVGISVEFCSHITRTFSLSTKHTRVLRAQDALCQMGSSVLSGITLTDCGILVLAFAKSQIFKVFYFRMYLGIIVFGTLHSLIFLPVFLSLFGSMRNTKHKFEKNTQLELELENVEI